MSTIVQPGDIFAAKLPDGRYKVVRVIRKVEKSFLVCTSEYLQTEPPSLDDPLIRTTVIQHRFYFQGVPARYWLTGVPTSSFEFVGHHPPTLEEAALECAAYAGKWDDSTGNEAFLEWRWLHDRPAFDAEVQKQQEMLEQIRRLPQKPKAMMTEDDFWSIIQLLDWNCSGEDERVLAPAINALASKSKADIRRFEERFAFFMYQIDTKAHASNLGEDLSNLGSDYVSADGFVYARCFVVANGREFYESVLNDPAKMPKDMEFESLLGLASTAYELKTGGEFEYSTGCSYESFSNLSGWLEKSSTN